VKFVVRTRVRVDEYGQRWVEPFVLPRKSFRVIYSRDGSECLLVETDDERYEAALKRAGAGRRASDEEARQFLERVSRRLT